MIIFQLFLLDYLVPLKMKCVSGCVMDETTRSLDASRETEFSRAGDPACKKQYAHSFLPHTCKNLFVQIYGVQ
jgi:hypothetical protein